MRLPIRCALWLSPALLVPFALPEGPAPLEFVSNDGTYRLTVTFEPEEVPLNEYFDVHFTLARADGKPAGLEVDVDARMPHHGHGMNRDAIVERRGAGEYTGKNLLFHMPGYWEVHFDVTEGAVTERAQASVELD